MQLVLEMAASPQIYENLAKSLAPGVFGPPSGVVHDIKKAVLLMLVGGVSKVTKEVRPALNPGPETLNPESTKEVGLQAASSIWHAEQAGPQHPCTCCRHETGPSLASGGSRAHACADCWACAWVLSCGRLNRS